MPLDVAYVAEAGVRAAAFWLFLFNRTYRAQVVKEWRQAGWGHRTMMMFEWAISIALGIGIPLLGWRFLS